MFSIHDSKLNVWSAPMMFEHSGQAERAIQEIFQDQKSQLNKYPEDFTVFQIGDFDSDSALLTSIPPHHLITIKSLLKPTPPNL